jgi:hypothetical protein
MLKKMVPILSFVFLAITPSYAASPEQPSSVTTESNTRKLDIFDTIRDNEINSIATEPNKWIPKSEILIKEEQPNSVPVDQNAIKAIIEKANKGDANAQYELSGIYLYGKGIPQDGNESMKWLKKSAEGGHAWAQKIMILAAHDYNDRIRWCTKAAERGDAWAQLMLGAMYNYGEGVIQDYNEAAKWYRKAAEQGDANAQRDLGTMYYEGKGVPQDYKEAIKWYRKAAEQGDAEIQFFLGRIYALGIGIAQDYNEAIKWLTKAAEQGNEGSKSLLGLMNYKGDGGQQSNKEAINWYIKTAEIGLPWAQTDLGVRYYKGEGVIEDYNEAAKWVRKAAEQNWPDAQFKLGIMYYKGEGVPQDYKESVKWYKKAAEQGLSKAQFILGNIYYEGKGVIEDYIEAYKWTLLAGMNGEDVANAKKIIAAKMTPSQIAEAQKLAKEFVAKKENDKDNGNGTLGLEEKSIPKSSGTGFFISPTGYILTAAHVAKESRSLKIFSSLGKFDAKVVLLDEPTDIAILKVDGAEFPYLEVISSSSVNVGDKIFTFGFPNVPIQGTESKYTDGTISSLSGIDNNIRHFQVSIPVQPGNSGGPLLSEKGEVIGVIVSRLDDIGMLKATGTVPQNVNYAIKSAFIFPLLENLPGWQTPKAKSGNETMSNSDIINKARNAVALIFVY